MKRSDITTAVRISTDFFFTDFLTSRTTVICETGHFTCLNSMIIYLYVALNTIIYGDKQARSLFLTQKYHSVFILLHILSQRYTIGIVNDIIQESTVVIFSSKKEFTLPRMTSPKTAFSPICHWMVNIETTCFLEDKV